MRTPLSLINSIKNRIISNSFAKKDIRVKKRIVVFESDDWGSIRMPMRKGWEGLLKLGYTVDKRPYERFDTLESPKDLESLFEVLHKHKDCNGNHPIITANMLMANPDFLAIKESGFKRYYYEPIAKTYERYFGDASVLEIMKQGLNASVFMPQSHGREHFNIAQWLKGLQAGDKDLLTAFEFGMCGIAPKMNPERGNNMMVALRATDEEEQIHIEKSVSEGLELFKDMWGFSSKTFVAPCFSWNERIEKVLSDKGVKLIQTVRSNKAAYLSAPCYFYSGQYNALGLIYSIRNCTFEPSIDNHRNQVDATLKQIDRVFSHSKIAVISTHRINLASGIDSQNNCKTVKLLDELLSRLLAKYPDVEFASSDHLIDCYK